MKTLFPALALCATASLAMAQEPAPKPAAKPAEVRNPKIAVIDMGTVSSQSLMGKGYAAQLDALKNEIEAERTKKQNELSKLDASLKALQDEIE
jgi:Skp family chaperone for outer membrane proteins